MKVGKTVLASAAAGLLCLLVTTASGAQDEDDRKYAILKAAFEESQSLPVKSLFPLDKTVEYRGRCFSLEPSVIDGSKAWDSFISIRLVANKEDFFAEDVILTIDGYQRCVDLDRDHAFQCESKMDIPSFYKAVGRGGSTYLLRKIDYRTFEDTYCWYTIK